MRECVGWNREAEQASGRIDILRGNVPHDLDLLLAAGFVVEDDVVPGIVLVDITMGVIQSDPADWEV
ncbi:MAG: hypothetical protein MZV63_14885 [Marinilabiliales bacterium]|nr:hypothetical protein [Marinilabiliales bacterium]